MKILQTIVMLALSYSICRGLQIPETENYILNENSQQVIDTKWVNDPIRDGAFWVVDGNNGGSGSGELQGILWPNNQISDHVSAKNQTLQLVKNVINYALWFLAVIALVYLIYNGFLMVTAGGDDAQYKKGLQSLKYAAIAIAGIWASRLIVSLIFWIIALIITP